MRVIAALAWIRNTRAAENPGFRFLESDAVGSRPYRGTPFYWWTNASIMVFCVIAGLIWHLWFVVAIGALGTPGSVYIAIQQHRRGARASLPKLPDTGSV